MSTLFVPVNGLQYNVNKLNEVFPVVDVTVSGTGVAASQSISAVQVLPFTITAATIAMTDAGAAGSHGALKIATFPAGNVSILGATTNLTIARVGTALTTTSAVVSSLGSVTVSTADATLTSTEANIVPSTVATLSAGAGTVKGESTGAVTLDGTTTAAEVYLNFATPDAGSTGNDSLTVNGTIYLMFVHLGDN